MTNYERITIMVHVRGKFRDTIFTLSVKSAIIDLNTVISSSIQNTFNYLIYFL